MNPALLTEKFGFDIDFVICSSAYDVIRDQLVGYGFSPERIKLFNFAFMDLEYTDASFVWDHIADFERAYARMGDETSRSIFCHILNYKITKDERFLEELNPFVDDEAGQYFDGGLYDFLPDERFLDVGAYTGDTLEAYDRYYHGEWEKYFGLEADRMIFNELALCVKKMKLSDKVKLFNIAAWDSRTSLTFDDVAGSSEMKTSGGSNIVQGDRLDNILGEDTQVTIVKMDIEGSEGNALLGAREIIIKNHPILAICVYHKRDDLFRLTDIIEELCPHEYSYYLRQYRYTPTETVCYAIPRDRLKDEKICGKNGICKWRVQ